MRLIDADALWKAMQKEYTNGDCGDDDRYNLGINVGISKCYNLVSKAHTIDAVERDWADLHWNPDEWCTDCKEYDKENHRCPRWNKVIRKTFQDALVRCKDCKHKRMNCEGTTRYYYCALEDRPNRQWSIDETDFCSWGERRE